LGDAELLDVAVEGIGEAAYMMSIGDGRIFIDYLRNGRGTTAIGAWSPRARAGFPIAVPVSWRQIENAIRPDTFTMERPPRR
jgi:DNA primase